MACGGTSMAFKCWDTIVGAGWDSGLRLALWSHFSLFLLMRRHLYEEITYLSVCHGFKVFETQVHRLWSIRSGDKPKLFYFLTVQSWAKSSLSLSFSSLKWGWETVFALLGGVGGGGRGAVRMKWLNAKKLPHKKFSRSHFSYISLLALLSPQTWINRIQTDVYSQSVMWGMW